MSESIDRDAPPSQFAQTPKWRIHYHDIGSGEPLVMLHGSGPGATSWSNFKQNIAVLSERFRCIAVDMPGWGQSDTAVPDDRDHVEALIAFLDAIGLERAVLIGNSMGGMTAVRTAAEHPDRVKAVIAMGAPSPGGQPVYTPGGAPTEGLKVLLEGYADPTPETMMKLVQIMCYGNKFADPAIAEERARAAQARPDHLKNYLDSRATGTFAGNATYATLVGPVSQIKAPALIIHGRDDRTVLMEHGLRLVSMIPDSRLVVLNRCGHWAQLEHADEFNRLVTQFVENLG